MNYFEFYGIPESFNPDEALLKKKFYELSKRYHPDFYANEDDEKQQEILELSTINNKAYNILSNPAKRLEYILQLYNLLADGDKYQLSPNFLMEMMEINENLMEADSPEQVASIKAQIADTETQLNSELLILTSKYAKAGNDEKQTILKAIKDIYYRQKYLLRIKDTLATFAARL